MFQIKFKQLNHLNEISNEKINEIKRQIRKQLGQQIYFEYVKSEKFYRIYDNKKDYLQDVKDREIYNSIGEIIKSED